MANRNFANSRIYSGHVMPVLLDANFAVGASGAVSSVKGPYIKSIARLGTGLYQIQMQDNYSGYFGGWASFSSAASGSAIDPNAGTPGKAYVITTVGDTDWTTAGVPAGVTPAIGVGFGLAAAPAAGTGRVKALVASGIHSVEVIGNPNLSNAPISATQGGAQGAVVLLQCYGATAAGDTTLIAADPANGSTMRMSFYLSNSSIQINGE